MPELLQTAVFGLPPARVGKVREVYDLGDELLIIATDRVSAFDAVMANGIPDKGVLLNLMSAFWFDRFRDLCPNHVITTNDVEIQTRCPRPQPELAGRSLLARKAKPLPIECVARGYLTGSLLKEYLIHGDNIHELAMPGGLMESDKLPEPIFTPATKAEQGHDENISFVEAADHIGRETAEYVREMTLRIYRQAAAYALERGIILADTKFEFGETPDGIIWIDEALTPDSSRFWDASRYAPGRTQPSYDKQFVRDYLETLAWDKTPPGPVLPPEIVEKTREKYLEAYTRLTGQTLTAG